MLISIITPAYNSESLIAETIDSVLNQTHEEWEFIVVDDASSDGTCDLVRKYMDKDPRIQLISVPTNFGAPAGPRNIGVAHAKGDWVAFLDSDDIWHPEKLERQLAAVLNSESVLCSSGMKDFSNSFNETFVSPDTVEIEHISFAKQQFKGRIPTSSVLVKTSVMKNTPFEESIEYKAVEDYHCWLRIHARYGDTIKLNYPFLRYRRVAGQISGSKIYMLGRMYMLHREYPGGNIFKAIGFTLTHFLGGVYFRLLKGEL